MTTVELPFVNLAKYAGGMSLQIIDVTVWEAISKADSTGSATVQSDPIAPDEFWLAQRLVIDSSSLFIARVDCYEGTSTAGLYRRDWSPIPYRYPLVRPYVPSVLYRSSTQITAVISGAAQGDVFQLSLTYAKVKKVLHPR